MLHRRDHASSFQRRRQVFQLEQHNLILADHRFDSRIRTRGIHSSCLSIESIHACPSCKKGSPTWLGK